MGPPWGAHPSGKNKTEAEQTTWEVVGGGAPTSFYISQKSLHASDFFFLQAVNY